MPAPYGARRSHEGRLPRFGASDLGVFRALEVFDPSVGAWEDRAGVATPATVGGLLGRLTGKLGNHYLAATTDGARPLLLEDARGRYVECASGKFLVSAATATISTPLFMVAAISKGSEVLATVFGMMKDSTNYALINNNTASSRLTFVTRETALGTTSLVGTATRSPINTVHIVSVALTGGGMIIRTGDDYTTLPSPFVDGVSIPTAAITLNANTLTTGASQSVRLYGAMVGNYVPTPREWDSIHDHYNRKLGL